MTDITTRPHHARAVAVSALPPWEGLAAIIRPWLPLLGIVAALVLAGAALDLAPPFLVRRIVDRHLLVARPDGLMWLAVLYLCATAAAQVNGFLVNWLTAIAAESALRDLRVRVFAHVQRVPTAYFDRTPLGDLISRATADVDTIETLFSWGFVSLIGDCFRLLTVAAAMTALSPRLTLAAALVLPVVIGVTRWFRIRVREAERAGRRAVGQVNVRLQETLGGVELIRAFGGERTFTARFVRELKGMLAAMNRSTRFSAFYSPLMALLSAATAAALLWSGARAAVAGTGLSIGTITAFVLLFQKFFDPIISLGDDWQTVQGALSGFERIQEVLAEPVEQPPHARTAPRASGDVADLTEVVFGYAPDRPIVRGLSLSVAPGEHLVIVGRTGAGKTTLLHLLGGLYAPWSGRVRVQGADPRGLDEPTRRRTLGIVPQMVQLFSGTVRENLTFGDPTITEDAIRRAATIAGIDGLIEGLPQGYATPIAGLGGGAGVELSAGQRQLLALARALAADPALLVLDEATSAVDVATDQAVREALRPGLAAGHGVITVAHRLSTAAAADRVVVMEAGSIVEAGAPADLIARGGRFAALLELERAGWDWEKD